MTVRSIVPDGGATARRTETPGGPATMKIATWNVNGIRARQDAGARASSTREQPDVLCLQEIKATREQVPETVCDLARLLVLLARRQAATRASALHVRKELAGERADVHASGLRPRDAHRGGRASAASLVASVYVPNGGKDFAAKMRFLEAMVALRRERCARPASGAGPVRRPQRRAHATATCTRRSASRAPIGQRPDERALFERDCSRTAWCDVGRALDPDNDALFTWWAPWRNLRQRNIGWRLDYVLASDGAGARRRRAA